MRTTKKTRTLTTVLLLGFMAGSALAEKKNKPLNRSIYMPIEFQLCDHLEEGLSTLGYSCEDFEMGRL